MRGDFLLVLGQSRETGPRATMCGRFLLWSDDREGQALALRCVGDFFLWSDDREGQALALRCAGDFQDARDFLLKNSQKNLTN